MILQPNVSLVFPILNGIGDTLNCLKSISNLNYPKNKLEVIVFDNGSQDNSATIIKKKYPQVKVIQSKKNLGFAKAVNITLKAARGKYFFITNNDVVLEKKSIQGLVSYLEKNPHVGIVGPRIYNLYSKKEVLGKPLYYHFTLGIFTQGQKTNKPVEVDWVQGCGLCISKRLWRKLDGFDEEFFFTGEELDLCTRAKHLGFKVKYLPAATIWHSGGATINQPQLAQFKYLEGYKSKFRLIIKHGNLFQIITAFILQLFLYTPFRTLVLREKSFIPMIQAFSWNFKNLKKNINV